MEAEFWHERWSSNRIAFHEGRANKMLVTHFSTLGLAPRSRVFVPLCGKTRDIAWLMEQGMQVAGAELSELAVQQLFEEMSVHPEVSEAGPLKRYASAGIDIYAGDIFALSADLLGRVDAVFDRAALVALPGDMRPDYARHLTDITGTAPQLLVTFEYDQSEMDGPPFSLSDDNVRSYYAERYNAVVLSSVEVEGGLKGICAAEERAWHLGS
ncbi:MAG: thiopurine S-methyltransferase [Pseudomonadota bacterium]